MNKQLKQSLSYPEFVGQQFKKRPPSVSASQWMKEIGMRWRKMKGNDQKERERDERKLMAAEYERQRHFMESLPQPRLVLDTSKMTGPVFDNINNSPTFEHYIKRSKDDIDGLIMTYNSLPNEIKDQYNEPRTPQEIFSILKNQRRGMIKRRRL